MLISWKRCALEFGATSRQAPMMGPSSELLELLDTMSKAAFETRAMQPADLACAGAHGAPHLGLGGQEGAGILWMLVAWVLDLVARGVARKDFPGPFPKLLRKAKIPQENQCCRGSHHSR